MKQLVFFITLGMTSVSMAAGFGKFQPKGISGWVGGGVTAFTIKNSQAANLRLDQGVYASLGGEKGFGLMNLYLTFGFNYLTTQGKANYRYSDLATATYTANDSDFQMDLFGASLGLKLKIIDGYWFRPYVEAGGFGGYYTLSYKFSSTQKAALDAVNPSKNYKTKDSIIDFGQYGEAGLEISFSDSFGLRPAARLIQAWTKKYETLGNTSIEYDSVVYYLTLLKAF